MFTNADTTVTPAGADAPLQAILSRFQAHQATRLVGPTRADRVQARYGFRVGNLGLLVAPLTGLEVVANKPIAPLPRSPEWLRGMMNLRGNPVPVFDLVRALDINATSPANDASVLVLEAGSRALGIAIEGFPQPLRNLTRTGMPTELPRRLEPYVQATWLDTDAIWVEFDHRAFFLSLSGRRTDLPS